MNKHIEKSEHLFLNQARLIFETVLETIKNMELLLDDKQKYIKEVTSEIDAIDVEIFSRGN